MSEKHFVGMDLTGFEDNGKMRPISRVTLLLDDENEITAGDDSGYELTANCPHATQEMANNLLAQLKGYQYQMFSADAARIDPAAELGDGITVSGIYSVISSLSDDGSGYYDVSAPGETELEDEFPSAGPMTQEFNRKMAQTRSLIEKSASEIQLAIEATDGRVSKLSITIDGVTVTGSDGKTKIKGSSIETSSIAADSIRADQVNLTGAITFDDLDQTMQLSVTSGVQASTMVKGWTYSGTTYIDGGMLATGTVKASKLLGGTVGLLDYTESQVGGIDISSTTTGYGLDIWSSFGGIRLRSGGNVWFQASTGQFGFQNSHLQVMGDVVPGSLSGGYNLGASNTPWGTVYATTGTIQSSDKNIKHSIECLPDKYAEMLDRLEAVRYKLDSGTSDRYHVGFIAQQVQQSMKDSGIDSKEFGGFIIGHDDKGNDMYMLRYEEFIAILLAKIQQMDKRIKTLEAA